MKTLHLGVTKIHSLAEAQGEEYEDEPSGAMHEGLELQARSNGRRGGLQRRIVGDASLTYHFFSAMTPDCELESQVRIR